MIICSIELINFRNFEYKKIDFSDSVNVIFGFNGQGKTNILEAISISCLSRSFRTKNDLDLLQHHKDNFTIKAKLLLDNSIEKNIRVDYRLEEGKKIEVDSSKISSVAEHFSSFPLVILSPEDDIITTGPPNERRKFINFVLSQVDKDYLKLLQDFQKTLKQRNKILQDYRENRYRFSEKIEPWNENLFNYSKKITYKRKHFLETLERMVKPIHQELTIFLETLSFIYKPSLQPQWDSYDKFKEQLNEVANDEIIRGITLFGPHRDEIIFSLDGYDLRKYGSRGQHRSLLLALKIAVYKLIMEKKRETPVFLLDDVYSEIDDVREKAFNDYFLELKQVFITTHNKRTEFNLPPEYQKNINYILIENNNLKDKKVHLDS